MFYSDTTPTFSVSDDVCIILKLGGVIVLSMPVKKLGPACNVYLIAMETFISIAESVFSLRRRK